MTERRYALDEITRAADAPLAKARQQATVDRALDLFAQGLIDALKALPPDAYTDDPAPSIYHSVPPRLPQESDD